MRKILLSKQNFLLISGQFISIFASLFAGYLIDPIRKHYANLFFIIPIVFVICVLASSFLTILINKKMSESYKLNIYMTIFNICISAVLLTIIFRIIVLINKESFFAITGFISVILEFCYIMLIVLISFIPFIRKKHRERIVTTDL